MPKRLALPLYLYFCSSLLSLPSLSFAAPGDADDDGIPDAIEAEIDIDNDGIADFSFHTEPFFTEDFGTGEQVPSPFTNYEYHPGDEIQDGQYAVIAPDTRSEYWMTDYGNIVEDFTANDVNGRAFGVNSAFEPGEFYRREMSGLVAGASYIFSAWIINTQPTAAILPNVRFAIVGTDGVELSHYESGDIAGSDWIQSTMVFESPDGGDISLILSNNAPGGIGNDLLLDDIEFLVGYRDFDNDGTPDYLDRDSDNDGVGDDIEGLNDSDGDGLADSIDLDSDNDGLADSIEALIDGASIGESGLITDPVDTDADGKFDMYDRDSDNDGLSDTIETQGLASDTNLDGVIDNYIDQNRTGHDDVLEVAPLVIPDTDLDGIADYRDTDSDNDGLGDTEETGWSDTNSDGVIDVIEDADNDGLADIVPLLIGADADAVLPDADANGVPDYRQGLVVDSTDTDGMSGSINSAQTLDSDSDGVPDFIEIDASVDNDMDGDGLANHLDRDSDNDGIADSIEALIDGASNGESDLITNPIDSDGDGNFDMYDRDSDNDGLSDTIETQGLASDSDLDGVIENYIDENLSGHDDSLEVLPVVIPDTDLDGIADYRDTDSDNDGLGDTEETGWGDFNGDGIIDVLQDADNDGLADLVPLLIGADSDAVLPDEDADGVPDYRQGLVSLSSTDPLLASANSFDGEIDVGLEGRGCSTVPREVASVGIRSYRPDPLFSGLVLGSIGVLGLRRRDKHARGY